MLSSSQKTALTMGLSVTYLAQAQAAEDSVVQLEAVTVSANKFSENLQTSSSSVTVITAEDIKKKGIDTIDAITKILPNSSAGSFYSGVTDWHYRGLSSSLFKGNNPVIIYVDGIAQTDRRTMNVDMKNVERIEIIHGPSGTTHGKGAIGGVINITTKQASNKRSGEISAQLGEHGTFDVSAQFNGPLIQDKLHGKLALRKKGYDGVTEYLDKSISDVNDDRSEGSYISGQVDFFPDDVSSLTLQINNDETETGYGRNDVVGLAELNTAKAPTTLDYNTETVRNTSNNSQTIKYEREIGRLRVEGQLNNRTTEWDGVYECDYSSAANIGCFEEQRRDNKDAEIRLVSDMSDMKWVLGAFYSKSEKDSTSNGYESSGYLLANSYGTQSEDTQALFGQLSFPITSKLEITGGVRVQQQTYKTDTNYYQAGFPEYGVPETNDVNVGSEDESAVLPKFGASYAINDKNNVFFSYSKGYLGGGHNEFQSNASGNAEDTYFKPQTNDSFEIGYKANFKRAKLTASAFYMDISDIHTFTLAQGSLYTAGNIEGAISKGVELEAQYSFNDIWSIDGSFGVTNAKYKKGASFDGVDASEKTVENMPDQTIAIGLNYNDKLWNARLEASHKGDYYYDFQNTTEIDGGTELNARVSWKRNNVEVFGYLNNITDEEIIKTVFDATSLTGIPESIARSFNNPRTLGVGFTYSF